MFSQQRERVVNQIAIESSARGDGRFIEEGTVTRQDAEVPPMLRAVRAMQDFAAVLDQMTTGD